MQIDPIVTPYIIATASVVVVPLVIWLARLVNSSVAEARNARLKKAIHGELEPLFDQQKENHQQNRDYLDTIRTEAWEREKRIVDAMGEFKTEMREDLRTLHGRVDDLLKMTGDRRRTK